MAKQSRWLIIIAVIICSVNAYSDPTDTNGVQFELTVRQKPAGIDNYYEIIRDTVEVIIGKKANCFIVNMNLGIDLTAADSQFVTFTTHLTTIGKDIYSEAKRFRVELNLPGRYENIPGKNGAVYQLLISPRNLVTVDTGCTYYPNMDRQYEMSPAAYFDIHYIKGSLAEYHWSNVKNYLEADYARFRNAFDINMPGKINVFLCPCPAPTLNWDKRFGYAIDPGRMNIFAIYNHSYVSLDAIIPNLMVFYRLWGYAPPFVAEGLAGYFEFSLYNMKKVKEQKKTIPLKNLMTSSGYFAEDPQSTEVVAASFMRYLADRYGLGKIRDLYELSDDLNLQKNLELIYEMPLDSLEKNWLYYVDTVKINRWLYDYYAGRASILYRSDKQMEYLNEMAKIDTSRVDSIDTWTKLATTYYQFGEFYKAAEAYKLLMKINQPTTLYKQILGNLYMINGEYDNAYKIFDSVFAEDSTYATARLHQAKIEALKGDTARAIKIAEDNYIYERNTAGKVEFLLFLGQMYGTQGANYDSAKAESNFSDALIWINELIPQAPQEPILKLRAGVAYLGLKRYNEARQYLELTMFTEMRSYLLARTMMYLGNVHDALGDHERAVLYYQKALATPLADFDREACERYIDEPYKP